MSFILLFIITNAINVIISTWKSIVTVNGSKMSAAFWNALGYGYYAYIVVLTATGDLPTWQKVIIVFGCNLIGVYAVKWFEERTQKEKLWKVELTVNKQCADLLKEDLNKAEIPCNYVEAGKWAVFNVYCYTKKQSGYVAELGKSYHAKFFASEAKNLY